MKLEVKLKSHTDENVKLKNEITALEQKLSSVETLMAESSDLEVKYQQSTEKLEEKHNEIVSLKEKVKSLLQQV